MFQDTTRSYEELNTLSSAENPFRGFVLCLLFLRSFGEFARLVPHLFLLCDFGGRRLFREFHKV